jgi:hypothetical protein
LDELTVFCSTVVNWIGKEVGTDKTQCLGEDGESNNGSCGRNKELKEWGAKRL